MNSNFEDFVDEKVNKHQDIDWKKRKAVFLGSVDILYEEVESWLKPLTKSAKIRIDKNSTVEISEDHIGKYKAPVLLIEIGSARIKLIPIGALIIASRGRVDIIGDAGKAMLLLNQKGHRPAVTSTIVKTDSKKKSAGKTQDINTASDSKKEPGLVDLEWLYAEKTHGFEYTPLNKDLFESIIMAVS